MPDYKKGKIYAIKSYQTDKLYIGSTTQLLSARLGKHKTDCKDNKGTSKNILQYDDAYIVLIENCPCNNKEELGKRERYYIEQNIKNCVNVRLPTRKQKEYKETNKEKIRESVRKYTELNKEKKKEYYIKYKSENDDKILETKRIYREKNRSDLNEKGKEYYEKNKEKILNRNKEKKICECGVQYTIGHKLRHDKTKRHIDFFLINRN